MNVVDGHFDRELGASGAARCGMLVTAMLMIMQKRLPGPNGQSGTWIRSIVMKRAVEGERDRADRPVGAVDVKLATMTACAGGSHNSSLTFGQTRPAMRRGQVGYLPGEHAVRGWAFVGQRQKESRGQDGDTAMPRPGAGQPA
jgi:hypothetical protein